MCVSFFLFFSLVSFFLVCAFGLLVFYWGFIFRCFGGHGFLVLSVLTRNSGSCFVLLLPCSLGSPICFVFFLLAFELWGPMLFLFRMCFLFRGVMFCYLVFFAISWVSVLSMVCLWWVPFLGFVFFLVDLFLFFVCCICMFLVRLVLAFHLFFFILSLLFLFRVFFSCFFDE